MALSSKHLAAVGLLALLPLGACASDGGGGGGYGDAGVRDYGAPGGFERVNVADRGVLVTPARLTPPESHDGLLSSPPNNARPGECYAKVVVPGQPIGAPPAQRRAVWVQTPPGPGQISPTWCIYYLPGAPQPVAMTPERYGWIRVVCDKDATEEKIRHVQRRLHEWGDYDGAYDGHFDSVTAKGVVRFQEQRHIDHGGYLSVKTVDELDGAPPPGVLVPAFDAGHPNPNPPVLTAISNTSPEGTIYASPVYRAEAPAPAFAPAPIAAPAYGSSVAPCGVVACPAPPPVVYAPPAPPQIIVQRQVVVQRVIQPVYQQVYAPPPPPQVIYRQAPPQVIYQPSPPQVVVQKVVQPVYQPIYAQTPQMGCGQPACAPQPQPYPCGGPVCGAPGGQSWGGQNWGGQSWGGQGGGGGYGQQGPAPYRALLTWSGKTTY